MSWIRSCLARIGCLTLLVLAAGAAWMGRGRIADWWRSRSDTPVAEAPSRELANRASRRLDAFLQRRGPGRVEFDGPELQSLLMYRFADSLPPGISDPRVTVGDSSLRASAALQVNRLMDGRAPDAMRSLLGDSARASADLVPQLAAPGVLLLDVRHASAGGIPIPSLMVPWLLEQMGLPRERGQARAVAIPVPRDLTSVRVTGGHLRLERGHSN